MQREKVVQAHVVQFLRTIGATVYVLGTRRRRGDYQGTMQSKGAPDLFAFLPFAAPSGQRFDRRRLLAVECKAAGGRLSPEQKIFAALCGDADVAHVVGGLDAVIGWLIQELYVLPDQVAHYRLPEALRAPGS